MRRVTGSRQISISWGLNQEWRFGPPTYKHIRGPIWEIRTPTREGAIRTLFGLDGQVAVLLHGINKKRQKLDPHDLELAETRFKDYLRRKAS